MHCLVILAALFSIQPDVPERIAVTVDSRDLILFKHSVRGPDFCVVVQEEGGDFVEIEPGPVRTYRGFVRGDEESVVTATLLESGRLVVHPEVDTDPGLLTGDALPATSTGPSTTPHQPASMVLQAELGMDADYDYYKSCGYSSTKVTGFIESTVNAVNAIYVRDCLVEHVLGKVVIRTDSASCPYYSLPASGTVLDAFRNEWNTNQPGSDHDVAHLISGKSGYPFGGIAWVGVIGTTSCYGMSAKKNNTFQAIMRHELGHNWGCWDYHAGSPEGTTIMCGNSIPRFSGEAVKTILAHRDSRDCLDFSGSFPDPVAPYAWYDQPHAFTDGKPVTIDVLKNDHDANWDTLHIESFDAVTTLGGTVTRSTGPRDELIYTPPSGVTGKDSFTYTAGDHTGLTGTGNVFVYIRVKQLDAYWSFDEATGTTAGDSSGYGHHGQLKGFTGFSFDSSSVAGPFNGALRFDAANKEYIDVSAGDLEPPWTVCLWVKRENDSFLAADLFDSDAFSLRLEQLPSTHKVGISVKPGDHHAFNYTAPFGQWVHLAFVGTAYKTSLHVNGHFEQALGVPVSLPLKTIGSLQFAPTATLDDVRVYNYAMEESAIESIYEQGGASENPKPFNASVGVPTSAVLGWAPASGAGLHDVYLGTDYNAVLNATTASPEYLGRQGGMIHAPALSSFTDYFWRIDGVTPGIIPGEVWSFSSADLIDADLEAYYPFDGDTQDHSGNNVHGTPVGNPGYVGGPFDEAMDFNGSSQYVDLDAADLQAPWTVSLWVKRKTGSSGAAVLMDSALFSLRLEQWQDSHKVGVTRYGYNDYTFDYVTPIDDWVHLVFEGSYTNTSLYVNGLLAGTVNWTINCPMKRIGGTTSGLFAAVDDVAVWSRNLTQGEIQTLYNNGTLGYPLK